MLLPVLATAQTAPPAAPPKLRYPVHDIDARTPADLARDIFGVAGASFVESKAVRVPGVAEWIGVNFIFAAPPRASGYGGLCTYDGGSAYFDWRHTRDTGGAEYIELQSSERSLHFALLSGSPSLEPAVSDTAACAKLAPIFGNTAPHDLSITTRKEPADKEQAVLPANLKEAVFALQALRRAKRDFGDTRCAKSYPEDCAGLAPVGSFDLAKMYSIIMAPCDDERQRLCIDARIDMGGFGATWLRARVDTQRPDWRDKAPRVRSVKLTAQVWPIA